MSEPASNGYLPMGFDEPRSSESGRAITVSALDSVNDVDITLPRSGAVAGRITYETAIRSKARWSPLSKLDSKMAAGFWPRRPLWVFARPTAGVSTGCLASSRGATSSAQAPVTRTG